jgi:hypothetical protein
MPIYKRALLNKSNYHENEKNPWDSIHNKNLKISQINFTIFNGIHLLMEN